MKFMKNMLACLGMWTSFYILKYDKQKAKLQKIYFYTTILIHMLFNPGQTKLLPNLDRPTGDFKNHPCQIP